MTAVTSDEQFRQPAVKRLGLDDGWWWFRPHFLNFGLPLLFVDACLIDEVECIGLEPFGARRTDSPLPAVDLKIGLLGNGVSLYSTKGPAAQLVAEHWFRKLDLHQATYAPSVGILVGDSYALQLTWSELWRCRIGKALNDQTKVH